MAESIDQLLADAATIKNKTGVAGLAPSLGKIAGIFLQQGLPIIEGNKAVFASPKHVALLKKYAQAYKSGALLKDNLFSPDNFQTSIDAYKSGRLAILEAPPSALVRVRDDAKDIYLVTAVAPAPLSAQKIAAGGWLFHFAIPAGVKGEEFVEAGKLAKYLTNDANQLEFSKLAGTFPTTKKTAKDPHFQKLDTNAGAFEKAVAIGAENMEYIRTLYVSGVPDFEALNKRLQDASEAGITGRQDIAKALQEAAEFWNKKLQNPSN